MRATHITFQDGLLALVIIASWAFNITLIRIGALEMPPLFLLFIRYGLGTLIFLPFMVRTDWKTLKNLALYALVYVVSHLGLLYLGSLYISASLVGLIIQMGMPFGLLLGFIFYGERFGLKTTMGITLSFIGIFIILYKPVENFSYLGAFLILGSAFCWASGSLLMRRVEKVDLPTMTVISYALATPIIGALSYFIEDNQVQGFMNANHYWIGGILVYQIFLMSMALYFWKNLMSRNPVHQLTAFLVLQPLFVVLFGWLLLGETLTHTEMLGGFVILIGVVIITFRRIKKSEKGEKAKP